MTNIDTPTEDRPAYGVSYRSRVRLFVKAANDPPPKNAAACEIPIYSVSSGADLSGRLRTTFDVDDSPVYRKVIEKAARDRTDVTIGLVLPNGARLIATTIVRCGVVDLNSSRRQFELAPGTRLRTV